MDTVSIVFIFFFKVLLASVPLAWFITRFASGLLPSAVIQNALLYSIGAVFVAGSIYELVIYPLYRTPLRHLPTVKQKISNGIGMLADSPRGKSALSWMKQYPDAELIRLLGPMNYQVLTPCAPASLRDILSTRPYDFEKTWAVRALLARVLGFGLILSEGDAHRRQRRALNPCFNVRKIRELYGLMWDKTGVLLERLQRDVDAHPDASGEFGKVEMAEWASRLTLDIIGPTAMGRDFQSLTNDENQIADAFQEILLPSWDRIAYFALHFIIPEWLIRRVPLYINTMLERTCGLLRDTCDQIVREKKEELLRKEKLSDHDILSTIIQTGELSDDEVVDQMLTFLAAGHETTASALTWTCYQIQEKLRAEIREHIPGGPAVPVTYDVIESMPHLHGVCQESQRLYPTVPATIREACVDTSVAGHFIPRGTQFVIVPYAINRHPKFWGADADRFVPDRWIDSDVAGGVQRPNNHGGAPSNYAEITFLHGTRACIGRDFAKAELRCAVAGVVGRFEVRLQDPGVVPRASGVITTKPAGGMHLLLRPIPGW